MLDTMASTELDNIAKLQPAARAQALKDYLQRGEASLSAARDMRDRTIRELRATHLSRKMTANLAGVSVAHVAAVTGRRPR